MPIPFLRHLWRQPNVALPDEAEAGLHAPSLRRNLNWLLCCVVLIAAAIQAAGIYRVARQETEAVFDAQMQRMAATDARASDKEDLQNRRFISSLRKEFRGLPSVKDYETVLPIVESARKAPATPAGDLQIIYSVGKVLDPGSVVREGELQLTQNAQPWLSKVVGQYQKQVKGGAVLPKAIRDQFIAALDERVTGYRAGYERDVDQYRRYAQEQGLDPFAIVGTDLVEPYRTPASRAAGAPSQQDMDIVGNWLNKGQP